MKKITYYKASTVKDGTHFPQNVRFTKSQGYALLIKSKKGNDFHFALEYDRSERKWYATELTTGVGTRYSLMHKDPHELAHMLEELDLDRLMDCSQNTILRELLKKHIEDTQNIIDNFTYHDNDPTEDAQ